MSFSHEHQRAIIIYQVQRYTLNLKRTIRQEDKHQESKKIIEE